MEFKDFIFRLHAVERMFERGISIEDVRQIIRTGKIIEDYPNDKPFPSCMILGYIEKRPLHVVIAMDRSADKAVVITVYEPDLSQWELGFERRRR